ncbi:MAG: hypothetical protein WA913_16175 [Pricia sp.]
MKKIILVLTLLAFFAAMASCTTDDSNDIEIIKPGDTTIIGKAPIRKLAD